MFNSVKGWTKLILITNIYFKNNKTIYLFITYTHTPTACKKNKMESISKNK